MSNEITTRILRRGDKMPAPGYVLFHPDGTVWHYGLSEQRFAEFKTTAERMQRLFPGYPALDWELV